MRLTDSSVLLYSLMEHFCLSRSLQWTGNHSLALTGAVRTMGFPSTRDFWSKMGAVMVTHRLSAKPAEAVFLCDTARPTVRWKPNRCFSRPPCARWRKGIPCEHPPVLCKWTRTPLALGWIGLAGIAAWSWCPCGGTSASRNASWMSDGVLFTPRQSTCLGPTSTAKLTGTPGSGWPLLQSGTWGWRLGSANARKRVPTCCWIGSST